VAEFVTGALVPLSNLPASEAFAGERPLDVDLRPPSLAAAPRVDSRAFPSSTGGGGTPLTTTSAFAFAAFAAFPAFAFAVASSSEISPTSTSSPSIPRPSTLAISLRRLASPSASSALSPARLRYAVVAALVAAFAAHVIASSASLTRSPSIARAHRTAPSIVSNVANPNRFGARVAGSRTRFHVFSAPQISSARSTIASSASARGIFPTYTRGADIVATRRGSTRDATRGAR
jgi:hypothetical protein